MTLRSPPSRRAFSCPLDSQCSPPSCRAGRRRPAPPAPRARAPTSTASLVLAAELPRRPVPARTSRAAHRQLLLSALKIHLTKKSDAQTHLSPSRRRALRTFFVQSALVAQDSLQPRRVVGLRWDAGISRCERECEPAKSMAPPWEARRQTANIKTCRKQRQTTTKTAINQHFQIARASIQSRAHSRAFRRQQSLQPTPSMVPGQISSARRFHSASPCCTRSNGAMTDGVAESWVGGGAAERVMSAISHSGMAGARVTRGFADYSEQ